MKNLLIKLLRHLTKEKESVPQEHQQEVKAEFIPTPSVKKQQLLPESKKKIKNTKEHNVRRKKPVAGEMVTVTVEIGRASCRERV